jgi:hypothetical protein
MTPPHSFRAKQPLEYKTWFRPWHLYRGDFLHAILFNRIAKVPFALTSYTVSIFPFLNKQSTGMLGPQIGTTVSSSFCSCSWGPFSTLGLLRPTDFLHLHQNKPWNSSDADWTTARLLPLRPITNAIKRFAPFVFCIVEISSVHNKRHDCMGDQNTPTSSAFYSCC